MAGKRKRKRPVHAIEGDQKRQRTTGILTSKDPIVKQAILSQFYPQVLSLREYLILNLPTHSKVRRKKILSVGNHPEDKESDQKLSGFLDRTLIGVSRNKAIAQDERWHQWTTFSQRADDSVSFANVTTNNIYSQTEIVDFAIWLIFSKAHGRVQHLLCQGYRKDVTFRNMHRDESAPSAIPGIVATQPNSHVKSMKIWPWPQVLALMGKEGERTMIDLILDCGIFVPVESGLGTFSQLSGQPLGDLQSLSGQVATGLIQEKVRSPSNITFVRNRMLYARAALNAQGEVRFGLRHIHVLNRYPLRKSAQNPPGSSDPSQAERSTIQVMMYIFPRQFGLHNVFTEDVDPKQTVQPFKDYTLREDEINTRFPMAVKPKIPRRLRGKASDLVRKFQVLHNRCSYKMLLDHYCPVTNPASQLDLPDLPESNDTSIQFKTQISANAADSKEVAYSTIELPPRKISMMDHATPKSCVSAFCRGVLARLIPSGFWGSAENERVFHQNIDRFIELRRFESLSLHEVSQNLKIVDMEWLGTPNTSGSKMSQSDMRKRWDLLYELLYYVFDSILIPLIRANFHVTESNIHRYRLFYFRHDVWRTIAEPALASLKVTMFEEVKLDKAQKLLNSRALGFSQVRLLPKETGVRPIMNLRRRSVKKGHKNVLGPSINSVLTPVYNILTFEKASNPSKLGATLFSVGDLYQKLKTFQSSLLDSKSLYFAKVDVQAAFDTIPQDAVLRLISSLPSEDEYRFTKHVEIKPGENYRQDTHSKPIRKWMTLAKPLDDFQSFDEGLETNLAIGRKNTVFVENIVSQSRDRDDILELLAEHIQRNMVKIGKKFYRQKEGIPQGSVLSSLLCNYFYADLESQHLSFLRTGESLLLRLIDDFLLISTNRQHAKQFLQVMHDGQPDYGVRVNAYKTLVNFEVTINEKKVSRLLGTSFPYCGCFIDTKTLNITKHRERRKDISIVDSLTVEFSKMPGKTFHRKVLNTFKIQSHAMFLDTSFNSLATVMENVYTAFVETALKMWMYAKCLPVGKQPGTRLLIKTITDLIDLSFILMKSKGRNQRNKGYKCTITRAQVELLALDAFKSVLVKKQSKYGKVLEWIAERRGGLRGAELRSVNLGKRR